MSCEGSRGQEMEGALCSHSGAAIKMSPRQGQQASTTHWAQVTHSQTQYEDTVCNQHSPI